MRALLPLIVTALVIAGCGDSPSTTSYTQEVAASSATPTPTPSPSPTATASPSATPTPAAPATNGTEVKGGKVTVIGTEFKFDPDALSAKAGKVQVTLKNTGSAPHEIVFLKSDAAPDALTPGTDGTVPEKTSVGEVSQIPGGQSKTATISFKPGSYVFVCNIPGHYQAGMYGSLVVR
jgi:uncharacterized cupredoxin-like copper-binding protein